MPKRRSPSKPPQAREPRVAALTAEFLEDLEWWVRTDRTIALRLMSLMTAVLRDPFAGLGKPEPLKHIGADVWSRRLTDEHRVVYRVSDQRVSFLQGRYHY